MTDVNQQARARTATEDLVDRYVAVWSEPDDEARRGQVATLWADGAVHVLESRVVEGHAAIAERVTGAYRNLVDQGGFVFTLAGGMPAGIQAHNDAVTFDVTMAPAAGGAPCGRGAWCCSSAPTAGSVATTSSAATSSRAMPSPSPSPAEAEHPVTRRGAFAWSGYALFILFVGTNAPSPLYRVDSQRFGFSPLVLTLIFSVYMAAIIPSLLLFGPLSDAVGRREVLLPGLAVAMLGAAVFAAADGTAWLFTARAVQGLSMGTCSGALTAAMVEHEPHGDRRRALVVATGCIVAGGCGGPLLAGVLAQYGPRPTTLVFLVVIVALVPALVGVSRLGGDDARRRWRPRRPQVPRAILPAFLSASASSFLAWSVTGLFLTLVPSYALALSGSSNLALAGGIVAVLFACSGIVQLRGQAIPARLGQVTGLACLAIGLVLLVGAGEARSLRLLLAATIVAGVGQGLAFVAAMREVGEIAPTDRHADVMSSFYVVTYLGTGAPVIGVGVLANHTSLLRAVEAFAAVLVVLCLAALARHARNRPASLVP